MHACTLLFWNGALVMFNRSIERSITAAWEAAHVAARNNAARRSRDSACAAKSWTRGWAEAMSALRDAAVDAHDKLSLQLSAH